MNASLPAEIAQKLQTLNATRAAEGSLFVVTSPDGRTCRFSLRPDEAASRVRAWTNAGYTVRRAR